MGNALRKIKRGKEKVAFPSGQHGKAAEQIMKALDHGFNMGAKEQRKADIEHLTSILEGLEEIPGIGDKTAWKVREFFLQRFGKEGKS